MRIECELLVDDLAMWASGPDLVGRNIAAVRRDGFRLPEAAKMN